MEKQTNQENVVSLNLNYATECSALAFHKALIGISELRAIEAVRNNEEAGGLRVCKAIVSYYIAYHFMSSVMLLDDSYRKKLNKIPACDIKQLNSSDTSPEQWEKQRELEEDLTSKITHSKVKSYCTRLRDELKVGKVFADSINVFYNFFIKEDSPALYEKLCYIRDRAVYRPTLVYTTTGKQILTSGEVRKEIEEMPYWTVFYEIISAYYLCVLQETTTNKTYKEFVFYLWNSLIKDTVSNLKSLGYTEEETAKFSTETLGEMSSYCAHLIELTDKTRLKKDITEIWEPLKQKHII